MLIIGLSLFPKSQLHSIFSSLVFSQLHSIFSIYNGHFFYIYGACKAIDVDIRREVVIKTWNTSTNNRFFSISQEPTVQYFLNCTVFSLFTMDIFSILMVHAKLLMLIQDVKL